MLSIFNSTTKDLNQSHSGSHPTEESCVSALKRCVKLHFSNKEKTARPPGKSRVQNVADLNQEESRGLIFDVPNLNLEF